MCGSRKHLYPSQGKSLEIPRGRWVSKAKFFKGKYEAKLEIPGGGGGGGGGFKPKKPSMGRNGYFLEPHNDNKYPIYPNLACKMVQYTCMYVYLLDSFCLKFNTILRL